ncbi:MAG: hypothetical protein JST19_09200 [Bacteroidetes bacterium]|nr:hypothetical protein [Bacteroidota bacterium]
MKVNIKHISNLHSDALRGLDFYKQELGFLQERLQEVAGDNTGEEVEKQIGHFQDQFIIHGQRIDELNHEIQKNQRDLGYELEHSDGFAEEGTLTANEDLYEQYVIEERLFNEMRHEFNRFAAKWM